MWPAESREIPWVKTGNFDAFFREKCLTKKRNTKDEWNELLSTDKFLEDAEDENGAGFDPTGSTVKEDFALLKRMIFDLIEEVKERILSMAECWNFLWRIMTKVKSFLN